MKQFRFRFLKKPSIPEETEYCFNSCLIKNKKRSEVSVNGRVGKFLLANFRRYNVILCPFLESGVDGGIYI